MNYYNSTVFLYFSAVKHAKIYARFALRPLNSRARQVGVGVAHFLLSDYTHGKSNRIMLNINTLLILR